MALIHKASRRRYLIQSLVSIENEMLCELYTLMN